EGQRVGPTPDGRKKGEPTCDSIAAIRGKATEGPTAMLKSAAKLPQNLADGISVLNLTLSKSFVGDALRALVDSYFALGGIQVQVTCTSAEELQDALETPDKHRDLIVRVGGYSDYFVNLSPALRKTVVERNIHELA
ncbi:MAG: formate C-acetyltransferase/glycerol dehydratase family glycyl radical enzyme, partial [Clostridia bacterium]|nr:formate C-acetyltransferase/glycerol dehydratase family glycyl radical enzyme [Clostridia bacterium]